MKNLILLFSVIFLFSCNSDDDNAESNDNSSVIFTSYIKTYNRPETDAIESFKEIKTGDIINSKFTDYQFQTYINNELLSENTFQEYVYEDNKLIGIYPIDETANATKIDLYYDENNELTGYYWERADRYYQVTHEENNIDYFEVLTGSFSDDDTSISKRYILKFDENDNVIQAGMDNDFDGLMDFENTFNYDENNNLISFALSNGNTANYTYSEIKNTNAFILDNSYGKRERRLRCSELLGSTFISAKAIENLEVSTYLSNDEVNNSTELETTENNFYTKRTIKNDDDIPSFETMEFIIQ